MLPDFQQWKSSLGKLDLSLWSYLNHRADIELAVAFSKLFWPDFVEIEGCIFLAENYNLEHFEEWEKQFNGNRKEIEFMVNHVHVYDLFMNSDKEVPLEVYEHLGQVLMKCWNCALREAFPDRRFEFYYGSEPQEYGPTLSFWQGSSDTGWPS